MQKILESFYRKAKPEINRKTEKVDFTELFYLTTSLRKVKSFNSIEKQIANLENAKAKQTELLRLD